MRQSLLLSSEPSRRVTVQALSCWAFLYGSGRNILREKKLKNWCASYISIWPLLVETDLFKFKQVRLLCQISRMLLWHKSSSSFCAWTKRWLWAHKMIVHHSTKIYAQVIWEAVYSWRQSNSALFCKTSLNRRSNSATPYNRTTWQNAEYQQ